MTTKMREFVAIQRRQSEARAKFNAIDGKAERTEAEQTEHRALDSTLRDLPSEGRSGRRGGLD